MAANFQEHNVAMDTDIYMYIYLTKSIFQAVELPFLPSQSSLTEVHHNRYAGCFQFPELRQAIQTEHTHLGDVPPASIARTQPKAMEIETPDVMMHCGEGAASSVTGTWWHD
jgi:hypothetical protein